MWKTFFELYNRFLAKNPPGNKFLINYLIKRHLLKKYDIRRINSHFECEFKGLSFKMGKLFDFVPLLIQDIIAEKSSLRSVKENETVLDIGAYVGAYTIYSAKKVGENGQVIAIEPSQENFRRLKRNIKLNELENVKLINKAVWKSELKKPLYLAGGNSSFFNSDELFPSPNPSMAGNIKKKVMETVTVDEIYEDSQLGHNSFLKIDVMGSEIETLKGAENTLKQEKPDISVAAYYKRNGVTIKKFLKPFLRKKGYRVKFDRTCGRETCFAFKE